MLRLSCLRTVTLETVSIDESAQLAKKFPILHRHGKLSQRTGQEAQKIAEEALWPTAVEYVEDSGVVSPFWFSDDYSDYNRSMWCVIVLLISTLRLASPLTISPSRLARSDPSNENPDQPSDNDRTNVGPTVGSQSTLEADDSDDSVSSDGF